jgi:hypothetical protein
MSGVLPLDGFMRVKRGTFRELQLYMVRLQTGARGHSVMAKEAEAQFVASKKLKGSGRKPISLLRPRSYRQLFPLNADARCAAKPDRRHEQD